MGNRPHVVHLHSLSDPFLKRMGKDNRLRGREFGTFVEKRTPVNLGNLFPLWFVTAMEAVGRVPQIL